MGHIIEKIDLDFYVCVPLKNFIANVLCRVSAIFLWSFCKILGLIFLYKRFKQWRRLSILDLKIYPINKSQLKATLFKYLKLHI